MPPDVVERLISIAAENGLAHIALSLSPDDGRQARAESYTAQPPFQQPATTVKTDASGGNSQHYRAIGHPFLDALLDSGNEDAILAVEHLLRYFSAVLPAAAQAAPIAPSSSAAPAAGAKARHGKA